MAKLLIVEDEAAIRQMLLCSLRASGYDCREAENAEQARAQLSAQRPDLALLDIMLPGEDGFSLGRHLRELEVPMLFLTAKTAVQDRVQGLKMGAEDYILKPFEVPELLARVENILKRYGRLDEAFCCRGLRVDFPARQVTLHGQKVPLAAMEFDLLCVLIRRRNSAVSREELLRQVWGYEYIGQSHTLDVHIQRLRSKLGASFIETVYRYGYRFREREEA